MNFKEMLERAIIEEKNPKEFYNIDWCAKAQTLDLLRRQRELLEEQGATDG